MNQSTPSHALLHGGQGVPWELEHYIRQQQDEIDLEKGEQLRGHRSINEFMQEGVERIARALVDGISQERSECERREEWPRVPENAKQWTYLLHAYCRKHGQPAPAALMDLTFTVLSLADSRPDADLCRAIQLPDDVRNVEAFSEASALDGEADAAGTPRSVNSLATELGVTRATIRKWRDHPAYQKRRRMAAGAVKFWQEKHK